MFRQILSVMTKRVASRKPKAVTDPADSASELRLAAAQTLEHVHSSCVRNRGGAVADYIPELAKADPERFGIAMVSAAGARYSIGDSKELFTIQSVSKPLTFCIALKLFGREHVLKHVGVEPSGDVFNAIVFDPRTNRPFNPMVNAGAITITAMIHEALGDAGFNYIIEQLSAAAGRRLTMSEEVYNSEAETGNRNRAIGYLLKNAGAIKGLSEPAVDLYFRQCSILVSAEDLAAIGATLANIGTNPITNTQVFDLAAVRHTLSVMLSCGMYDYSGNWIFDVGVPAKSGVSGGIMGVVNRQLGLGVYSPRLDERGNSVRGIDAFRLLSDELGLHTFEWSNFGSQYLRTMVG